MSTGLPEQRAETSQLWCWAGAAVLWSVWLRGWVSNLRFCLQIHEPFQTGGKKKTQNHHRVLLGSFLNGNVCRRFSISHKLRKIQLGLEMPYNILKMEAGKNTAW